MAWALRRPAGQPESDRISIQIVANRWHPGVLGSFVIATLAHRQEVAYVQTVSRGLTAGDPKELTRLNEIFELVRSRALPVDQSLDLIRATLETRWT